jgi:hypothetical protein
VTTKTDETEAKKRDIAIMNNSALTPVGADNPFAEYANAALTGNITGTLLKFSKGDWLAGKENREIAPGVRMVANMDLFEVGWVRWSSGKRTDTRMGRVVDRFVPARRNDLGDTDEDLWETDDKGEPKNPWQFTNNVVRADPEAGEVYTFSTSSNGGRQACDRLCQAYGRERHRHPDE